MSDGREEREEREKRRQQEEQQDREDRRQDHRRRDRQEGRGSDGRQSGRQSIQAIGEIDRVHVDVMVATFGADFLVLNQEELPRFSEFGADLVERLESYLARIALAANLQPVLAEAFLTLLHDRWRHKTLAMLGGQVDAAAHFALKPVHQALTGARGVLRGDCDAAILDDDQFARAREMEGGKNLRAIYDSPALPPLPVVVFGTALTVAERQALVKALIGMGGNSEGAAICRRMHIGRFSELNSALFGDIQKRYGE